MNIQKTEDISVLGLSARTTNCLRRAGIHTVDAVLDYPIDQWNNLPNMGNKSVKELLDKINEIQNSSENAKVKNDLPKEEILPDPYSEEAIYIDKNGKILKDLEIQKLNISTRLKNALIKSKILYLSEILGYEKENFLSIKNMGTSTADEAVSLEQNLKIIYVSNVANENEELDVQFLTEELAHCYKTNKNMWLRELLSIRKEFPDLSKDETYVTLCNRELFQNAAKHKILEISSLYEDGIGLQELCSDLPDFYKKEQTEELVMELAVQGEMTYDGHIVRRKYRTFREFVSEIEDEVDKKILYSRMEGSTFAEIGNMLNISRERVRQRIEKIFRKRKTLYEDRYIYLYEHYNFSQEDFQTAFNEPKETYYYLDMVTSANGVDKKPISEILSDSAISVKMRKQAEKVIYRDFIMVDGIRILKKRKQLVFYFVKKYCTDLTKYDDFVDLYHDWLDEFGIKTDDTSLASRRYETYLNESDFVLWNIWRSFRYYDIPARDYTDLISVLNLEGYVDLEVSTYKFFRDYPDLMREYDIRDEYELHNLLKKIWKNTELPIDFKRMPSMEIGTNVNRESQVFALLQQLSPVTADDFAREYEEMYGAKANTLIGTHLSKFSQYFHDGIYRVDSEDLPQEQFDRMKAVLCSDFYSIKEVKRLYLREFPKSDSSLLTPYVLKTLGFRVYSGYVIQNRYSSAVEYFHEILTGKDIVDTRNFDRTLIYCSAYENEMHDLKANRTIIEFSPLQYIHIRRLNSMGITVEDIDDYIRSVKKTVDRGEYFTIHSLRKQGFSHPLDDLGFDDWFYASLLVEEKECFSSRRMGGRRLVYYGNTDITVGKLFETLVLRLQKIDVYDFQALLRDDYGLNFSISDIISKHIPSTNLYYDSIMETIYVDYETYFEEV